MKKTRAWRRKTIKEAALLEWEGDLIDEQISAQLGICRRTLARWKHRPEYQEAYAARDTVYWRTIEEESQKSVPE